MNQIEFVVYGAPVAQPRQRHRVVQAGGRTFSTNYTPKKDPVNQWKSDVKAAAVTAQINGQFPIWDGPVMLDVTFYLPRPAAHSRKRDPDGAVYHITKPDTDNLVKGVKDSLSGIIFRDDKQVCVESVKKFYHEKTKGPRAVILLRSLEG